MLLHLEKYDHSVGIYKCLILTQYLSQWGGDQHCHLLSPAREIQEILSRRLLLIFSDPNL